MRYPQVPRLQAYDLSATFGDGQPGRIEKCLIDKDGEYHLDTQAWEAGDVAYQGLKQIYPKGITEIEFEHLANDYLSMVCDDFYPIFLGRVEAGEIILRPIGIDRFKATWADYGWCERLMFAYSTIDQGMAIGDDAVNPLDTVVPLVLLKRLDSAVKAEFCDGNGLSDVILEIGLLRDLLMPPKHVQRLYEAARAAREKLDIFKQARRKGADAIHAENRSMKADVFKWLDTNNTGSMTLDDIALTIAGKVVPLTFRTVRDYITEWKRLRSAGRP